MKVTRIDYIGDDSCKMPLAVCNILMDDVLILKGIKLFCGKTQGYYLVFPSKQDIYSSVMALNEGIDLAIPAVDCPEKENHQYEEFFHPVNKNFYESLLDLVLEGYHVYLRQGMPKLFVYRPTYNRRKDTWQKGETLTTSMEN